LLNSESLSLCSFVIGVIDLAYVLASASSSLHFCITSNISTWFYSISVLCSVIASNLDSNASYSKVKKFFLSCSISSKFDSWLLSISINLSIHFSCLVHCYFTVANFNVLISLFNIGSESVKNSFLNLLNSLVLYMLFFIQSTIYSSIPVFRVWLSD
jgi:hypothetical protein